MAPMLSGTAVPRSAAELPAARRLLACATLAAAALFPAAQAAGIHPRLGTNLSEVADYATSIPFLDAFKQSRPWFTSNASTFDTGEADRIDKDAQGWPRSLVPTGTGAARFDRICTLVFSMGAVEAGPQQGRLPYPAGAYVVRYDGQGTLDYRLAARRDDAASAPGRDVVQVTPQEPGIQICITATTPGNPVRNIRLYLPGTEALAASGTFNPDYLARLRPFAALRFMDWMRTNNSLQRETTDRAQVSDVTYTTERGVPAEVMVDLANTLEAMPWFNMPHAASDAYVSSFARLVKDRLTPGRAVYVEYSNEIWNDQFRQGQAIEAEGVARFGSKSGSNFDRRLNRFGERTAEICTLWRTAFGSEASRVRCVVGGQAANTYIAETALLCPMSAQAPCKSRGIHGIAVAPYIGDWVGLAQHETTVAGWSREADGGLTRLFNELENGTELNDSESGGGLPKVISRMRNHATLATAQGVTLLAYEGGQHLVGVGNPQNNTAINTLMNAANRDARMGTLYTRYLREWKAQGGDLFMHFSDIGSASRFGRWGALELNSQTSSPKHNALVGEIAGCLFAWAEGQLPSVFSPAGTAVQSLDPYLFRAYTGAGGTNFAAISVADGLVYVLGPAFGGQLVPVGAASTVLAQAGCR